MKYCVCGAVRWFLQLECSEFVFRTSPRRIIFCKADSKTETRDLSPYYALQIPSCELFRHIKYWKPGVSVSHTAREGRAEVKRREAIKWQRNRGKSQRTVGSGRNNTSGTWEGNIWKERRRKDREKALKGKAKWVGMFMSPQVFVSTSRVISWRLIGW